MVDGQIGHGGLRVQRCVVVVLESDIVHARTQSQNIMATIVQEKHLIVNIVIHTHVQVSVGSEVYV